MCRIIEQIPLHGIEVVLNSGPCENGQFHEPDEAVSLPSHLFLILVRRFEAFDSNGFHWLCCYVILSP